MTESGRLPKIALGLAGLAVVLTGLATVVVVTRRDRDRAPTGAVAATRAATALPASQPVAAIDVVKLKRDADVVTEHGVTGVRVADDQLRAALGLERGDLITAISGRVIAKPFDVYDILLGTSMMNATTLYVEVLRSGAPTLVRWQIDGDLRTARYADTDAATSGLLGVTPRVVRDPLADTITKIDDATYQLPRSTIDAITANPTDLAKGARIVPSMKDGKPNGFKLYAIRPGSVYAAAGLQNGDTIKSINNQVLATPDSALEAYVAVKSADHLVIELDRRGMPVTISITITN